MFSQGEEFSDRSAGLRSPLTKVKLSDPMYGTKGARFSVEVQNKAHSTNLD